VANRVTCLDQLAVRRDDISSSAHPLNLLRIVVTAPGGINAA
jgi:hypothetical protein